MNLESHLCYSLILEWPQGSLGIPEWSLWSLQNEWITQNVHSKFTLISLFSKIHSLKSEHIHSFLFREQCTDIETELICHLYLIWLKWTGGGARGWHDFRVFLFCFLLVSSAVGHGHDSTPTPLWKFLRFLRLWDFFFFLCLSAQRSVISIFCRLVKKPCRLNNFYKSTWRYKLSCQKKLCRHGDIYYLDKSKRENDCAIRGHSQYSKAPTSSIGLSSMHGYFGSSMVEFFFRVEEARGGGGGTQMLFGRGCAAEAAKPVPIFKGHFGGKGYPLLGVWREKGTHY